MRQDHRRRHAPDARIRRQHADPADGPEWPARVRAARPDRSDAGGGKFLGPHAPQRAGQLRRDFGALKAWLADEARDRNGQHQLGRIQAACDLDRGQHGRAGRDAVVD